MLHSVNTMQEYTIQVTDGEIGTVDQLLFDDQHWTVRYLVVDTGGWLSGGLVLISPIAIRAVHRNVQTLEVDLTRQQVEQSPTIDAHQPVSRQKELEYFEYYGYTPYWGGAGIWGADMYPAALHPVVAPVPTTPIAPLTTPAVPPRATDDALSEQPTERAEERGDPHLRSTREVIDYTIQARDGDIGHVEDFLIDDESWTLRYMVVDTRNWLPGKQVLVAPRWISAISWAEQQVRVDVPRDTIKAAPEFDPSQPVDRDYEARLHQHYRRPTYWDEAHT